MRIYHDPGRSSIEKGQFYNTFTFSKMNYRLGMGEAELPEAWHGYWMAFQKILPSIDSVSQSEKVRNRENGNEKSERACPIRNINRTMKGPQCFLIRRKEGKKEPY